MPKMKMKTHSGAKKRFSTTKSGKIKRSKANKQHLNNPIVHKKTTKRKRRLRQTGYVDKTNAKAIKLLIPYK